MLRTLTTTTVLPFLRAEASLISNKLPGSLATPTCWLSTKSKEPFQSKPAALNFERPFDTAYPWVEKHVLGKIALAVMGYYSRRTRLRLGGENLYTAIQEQAENLYLQQALGLQPCFSSVNSLLCLHTWMLFGRLRTEERDGKDISQVVHDVFQEDMEVRVRKEGVKVRVGKWLTELEMGFYGSAKVYDKALKGEGNFTEALLRNVYENEKAKMHFAKRLERYIRREIACLAMTDTEALMKGQIQFTSDI